MRNPLTDKLAQSIGDPGSIVTREPDETVTRWSTRAVESVLGYVAPPEGLDARFVAVALTAHCSHCGEPYEGEFGPMRFTPGDLHKIADYGLDDSGWIVNINGLYDDDIGDRKLVCPNCLEAGWCEVCDEQIRAWQHVVNTAGVGVIHERCTEQPTTDTRPDSSSGAR
jgi:hypothetical protein